MCTSLSACYEEIRSHQLTGGHGVAYINEPKMPLSSVPGISALAKEPSQDTAAIRRISMDRTTASYV